MEPIQQVCEIVWNLQTANELEAHMSFEKMQNPMCMRTQMQFIVCEFELCFMSADHFIQGMCEITYVEMHM